MNICFLTDSIFSFGGVQRVTAVIAKSLAQNHQVTIVTLDTSDAEDTSLYGLSESNLHYRFFHYPKTNRIKLFFCKAYSYLYQRLLPQTRITSDFYAHSSFPSEKRKALTRELQQGHYDVIIGVHAPLAVRLASCRKGLQGVRLIGWIHNSYEALFGKHSLYIGPERERHYMFQLQKLHQTVVLCHYDAQRYPFPTQVIYNPLTLTPSAPSNGTSKRFLAIGRFSRLHKGFDLLIKAFHIFAQENREWMLDIVGQGEEESMYRQLIKDYHLENRIHLHPFTNDVQHYYSQAQVYVLSSRWEGFGLVLVEAMAHGLPVVSSDLPTSQEIMGDFGLYFTNGDVSDLARQLHAATRLHWSEKSRQALLTARRFSLDTITNEWLNILT
ncbi:MAG: glycosyltransferase [Prevotella sp.]|nr:glycosyltransferase [Prevotella sp.]